MQMLRAAPKTVALAGGLRCHVLPVLEDNYSFVVQGRGDAAVAVDVGDGAATAAFVEERGLRLSGVLTTHHHWDHVDGTPELLDRCGRVPVVGPSKRCRAVDTLVDDGDLVALDGLDASALTLSVPFHTSDHVAFLLAGGLFAGDTLFIGGAGRLFEGTADQMYTALHLRYLGGLPHETLVFGGHNYAKSNLRFALHLEPDNAAARAKLDQVDALDVTLPSTLADERKFNPFLRIHEPSLLDALAERHGIADAHQQPPEAIMAIVRSLKDNFR